MGDDEAAFQEFATAAMAQAAGTAPELVAAAPAEAPAADPTKVEPAAAAKEPEPAAVAKPEEKKEEIPAWKVAADAEKAKRASKSNETKLQAQLAAVQAELARFKTMEAKRETDPLGAAADFGLDYERLTKEYIKSLDGKPAEAKPAPEVQELRQKIQQVEGLLKQQQQVIDQRGHAEAIQSFKTELSQTLETKGDALEFVKKDPQGPSLVWEIRQAHYRETADKDAQGNIVGPGEIMSVDEACELAEKHLEKYLGNFKDAKKLTGKVEAPKPAAKPAAAPTLSQDMRQGETKPAPHGDEIEQLLALKKSLEAQLDAQQGN